MKKHIKRWKVTAEINMMANRCPTVVVKANTERKARILAEKKFKDDFGAFYVSGIKVEKID